VHRNSTKLGSWALIIGLPFIFANQAQAASTIANSAVIYDEGLFSGSVTINGVPAINGGPSTAGYNSGVVPGLATSGYGEAEFGALHASAFSGAANTGAAVTTTQVRGQGSAVWIDQVTISSPTLTGLAFARARFSLSGSLNSLSDPLGIGALGNSTVGASIQINGGTVFSTTGQLVSRNGSIITNDINRGQSLNGVLEIDPVSSLTGDFIFDIPFVFGTSFQMFASLNAATQAIASLAGDEASAASSFGSSGLWGGISDIHLADGTVLTGFSVGSESGFDYSNAFSSGPVVVPVPVPPTLWLLGSGLLALIGWGRRAKAA
jgi:hypothetical protein